MITCGGCGCENELGRVFCAQCGGKLDLSAMTSKAISEKVEVGFMRKHWPKFAISVVVLILAIYGLTFWPTAGIQTSAGTPVGAKRVETYLRSMASVTKGRTVAYVFKESDINGFFQYGKGKDWGMGEISVKCMDSVLVVHISDKMFTKTIGGVVLSPGTTYDMKCIGVGGDLIVRKVKKGHLGMAGPGKSGAIRKYYNKILANNGFDAFKYATDIKIEEGQVRVTVSNK